MVDATLYAATLNEKLKSQVPNATWNDGAKNLTVGSWYVVSRYNVQTAKYAVLTALIGQSGNLYDAVMITETAEGKKAITRPTTYKEIVNSLKN
jgi:hypothetical protein